jgi:hypothetical protein
MEYLLETKNITLCAHYIDTTKTDTELIMSSMNHVHGSIMFSLTHEINGQINFLDLLLIGKESSIEVGVYSKPTNTDTSKQFIFKPSYRTHNSCV